MYIDVLAKPARIVITYGLGVTKRFQNRISLEYLLLNPIMLTRYGRQVLQDEFRTLGLAGARLTANYHTLIMKIAHHVVIGIIADSEYMRR